MNKRKQFSNYRQGGSSAKSNLEFLNGHFTVLANFGELAEKYLYSDSNSCLPKLGMIEETIANLCFTYDRIPLPDDNTAANRINDLFREGTITRDLQDVLHALRLNRNKATHKNYASVSDGMVAAIEVKAIHKNIPSVIDYRCKDYSRNIHSSDKVYQMEHGAAAKCRLAKKRRYGYNV